MNIIEEIQALEDLIIITDSSSTKEIICKLINDKWTCFFKQESLSLKNKMQINLIKTSGLKANVWIIKYAAKFNDIYKEETNIEKIKTKLYRRSK